MTESKANQPSLREDITDFTGRLLEVTKVGYKHQSFNPQGNPFEGKSPQEMVDYFASFHLADLDLLLNSVKNVFEGEERRPQLYKDIVRLIEEKAKPKAT
jgi:hypothetical protein